MNATSRAELLRPPSVEDVKRRRRPLRDVNKEVAEKIGRLDKGAVRITAHVGTMGFFLTIFAWTVSWLGWNLLAPKGLQFDPPMAFVFWLFISHVIQLLLMPLIMLGQNILGHHAEAIDCIIAEMPDPAVLEGRFFCHRRRCQERFLGRPGI
jgi:uncharacterized membrane protein